MEGQKKRALSGAERQEKYVRENKLKSDLTQAKRQFERYKLLQTETDEAKAMREAARLRKQKQRARKKQASEQENVQDTNDKDENETRITKRRDRSVESTVVLGTQNANTGEASRQHIEGVRQKRKNVRVKNKTIKELKEENE